MIDGKVTHVSVDFGDRVRAIPAASPRTDDSFFYGHCG